MNAASSIVAKKGATITFTTDVASVASERIAEGAQASGAAVGERRRPRHEDASEDLGATEGFAEARAEDGTGGDEVRPHGLGDADIEMLLDDGAKVNEHLNGGDVGAGEDRRVIKRADDERAIVAAQIVVDGLGDGAGVDAGRRIENHGGDRQAGAADKWATRR